MAAYPFTDRAAIAKDWEAVGALFAGRLGLIGAELTSSPTVRQMARAIVKSRLDAERQLAEFRQKSQR